MVYNVEKRGVVTVDAYQKLVPAVLNWYDRGHRDLPWRKDRQPYHIWLSEIMLQQTRVEAVKGYYTRFLHQLPTIADLAQAPQEQLLKLWEGLGYYNRARNLQKAARVIMERHGGRFPDTYEEILALPGIGSYTAGAIGSIAFGLPTPAVDGNVLRVIARLTEDSTPVDLPVFRKKAQQALAAVYPERAGDFTQGLMELGATVCGPNTKPDCVNCPCREFCGGAIHGTAEQFPVRLPKKDKKLQHLTVLLITAEGKVALRKRPAQGLLANLWEFPHVPGTLEAEVLWQTLSDLGLKLRSIRRQRDKSHIFTHIRWEMRGFDVEAEACGGDFTWMTPEQITKEAALPTAFRQFWEDGEDV